MTKNELGIQPVPQDALAREQRVKEVRTNIVTFVIQPGNTAILFETLRSCTDDIERAAVFKSTLAALDRARTGSLIGPHDFDLRVNDLVRLDDSLDQVDYTKQHRLVREAIRELALADNPEASDGEITVFDEADSLEEEGKRNTPLGMAIRLCRSISGRLMEEKLGFVDVELGLCTPQRMASYINQKCYLVWERKNQIDWENTTNGFRS